MAKSNMDTEIRALVDTFVGDLTEMIRATALDAVREVLAGERTSTPVRARRKTAPRKAARKAKSGKRIRRSAAEVERVAVSVLAHVKKHPGQRLGEIASALGLATKDARRPAFGLIEQGKLETTGTRGGTRYFPKGAESRKAAKRKAAPKPARRKKAKKKAARR